MPDEQSPGGSRMYRHKEREAEFVPAEHLELEWMQAIEAHFTALVGEPGWVFHELLSDNVHVDVHVVPPGTRPFWTLFTTGMSARPMTMPPDSDASPYAELVLLLPEEWHVSQEAWKDGRWYWPVRLLKSLARLPHDYETWLGVGHTVPNGDPPSPYDASTRLCGALIYPSVSLGTDSLHVEVGQGVMVDLLAVYPLHAEEMDLKLEKGTDALIDAFDEAGILEIVDANRPSVVARRRRKRRFGLF
jgi:hypothetical protein